MDANSARSSRSTCLNSLALALALALKLNGLYTYLVTDTMACPLIDNGSLYRVINVSKPKDFWV